MKVNNLDAVAADLVQRMDAVFAVDREAVEANGLAGASCPATGEVGADGGGNPRESFGRQRNGVAEEQTGRGRVRFKLSRIHYLG